MRYLFIIISLFCVITSCKDSSNPELPKKYISFTNTTNIDRVDQDIVISKDQIVTVLDSLPANNIPVLKDSTGKIVPFQLDDLQKDGAWDELILVLDFKPSQTRKLELTTIAPESIPSFKSRTNIRFGIGTNKSNVKEVLAQERKGDPRTNDSIFYQMEGPSWENDKVGFRFYFDPRNGIDIFGKTTSDPVLDKVGLGEGNYHELADWGMDVLKVGKSLGAGALAIKYKDSLYRITGIDHTKFEVITEGPIRSIFEMNYKNSKIGDQHIDVIHRITIWKGQWGYQSDVFFKGLTDQMKLVSGIVNLKPNQMNTKIFNKYNVLETFGKQSENKDLLGMAILVSKADFITQEKVDDGETNIVNTYYTVMKASDQKPTTFYFLSGWEASDAQFKNHKGFEKMVIETSEKLSNPIVIN
ncbi:DUF4861 domain-containing protein [Aquimarina litoralis]|uniref:DUF4861 domain-containing protein n=1 Tax=Aquimarina litoralis TaxID=584605 RepID=UPI001C564283|nr:DUF4861 domain-containing protein [Aquimarina litoralis]MBW1296200.1 DUF4861 domain-containing protein [Aquimarina litoralis]